MTPREYPSLEALMVAFERGEISGAVHVIALHDDACAAPVRECSCSPTFVAEQLTAETYAKGQRAQARWLRALS